VAKSAAMDVDGLTKDNMDYGSSQLQTGDMLLPEPFLMMLKNCCASRYFSAAQNLAAVWLLTLLPMATPPLRSL